MNGREGKTLYQKGGYWNKTKKKIRIYEEEGGGEEGGMDEEEEVSSGKGDK